MIYNILKLRFGFNTQFCRHLTVVLISYLYYGVLKISLGLSCSVKKEMQSSFFCFFSSLFCSTAENHAEPTESQECQTTITHKWRR